MANIYDIIKLKDCLALVISHEQIGPDKILLKSLLIGEGFFNTTHEDFILKQNYISESLPLEEPFIELWNEPIFLIHNPKIKTIGNLTKIGQTTFARAYQNFLNGQPFSNCGTILSDGEEDQRHLFQAVELKTATILSLPAKEYTYALSDEKKWRQHENNFLKIVDKRINKLQQNLCQIAVNQ